MQWLNSENSGQDLMPNSKGFQFYISLAILLVYQGAFSQGGLKELPYLYDAPIIDGNLDEWKESAFSDGAWNIDRVKRSSWYNPKRNRLTVEENEDPEGIDLEATYYMAWDQNYIYLALKSSTIFMTLKNQSTNLNAGIIRTPSHGSWKHLLTP